MGDSEENDDMDDDYNTIMDKLVDALGNLDTEDI
jgi:hypothetical protein